MTKILEDFSLYLLTWNVVTQPPIEDLKDALGLSEENIDPSTLADAYAIGLQEVNAKPHAFLVDALFDDPWTKACKAVLEKYDYIKVKTVRMQGLVLILFLKRAHIMHYRDLETRYTRTGLGGTWGNKGGVTIRVDIYGCSVCIVNCHLAAFDKELQKRIQDYNSILEGQVFQDPETENIFFNDYVFWMGDVNFRLNQYTGNEIVELVEKGEYQQLLEHDELGVVRRKGLAFSELDELPPTFPPTYKYVVGKPRFDLGRRPAWTDRILYKAQAEVYDNIKLNITQTFYRSHPNYIQSDHKPVSALFTFQVFGNHRDRDVDFLPVCNWSSGEEYNFEYTVPCDFSHGDWDWIGLYKTDFDDTESYLDYVWATSSRKISSPEDNQNLSINSCEKAESPSRCRYKGTFPHSLNLRNEWCRLLYVTNDWGSVLGMSKPFTVTSH